MVRCSRSGQQCLTSVVGFDFARFAAAWVWGSCQTVFLCGFHCLTSSCYTCFWHFSSRYVHYVQFYFDKWLLRNIEFWKVIVWKSGRQQGQEAAVCWNSATVFPQALFVRKKKDNQTTHGCILAVSCEFHPRGFKHIFSQPSSGNCNLLVLMLLPLGPVFIRSYMWFSFVVISHAIYYHQSSFSPVGRFLSLGWDFGTLRVFDWRCLQRVRGMKNPTKFLRRLSQLSKHEHLLSAFKINFGLDS